MDKIKFQQIHHQLNVAQSALTNAKNLLKELEGASGSGENKLEPGTYGKFVGDHMVLEDGTKVEIPANYASKSTLVHGDKLKQYEENGEKKFKQVERVKRFRIEGILAKKEGRWHVVTSDGSYRVLDKAVEHYSGVEGDVVVILLPLDDKYAPFAAIESIAGKTPPVQASEPVKVAPKPEVKRVIKQPVPFKKFPVKPAMPVVVKPAPVVPVAPVAPTPPQATPVPIEPVKVLGEDDLR